MRALNNIYSHSFLVPGMNWLVWLCSGRLCSVLLCQHAISVSWVESYRIVSYRGRRCFIASDFVIVVDLLLVYILFFCCCCGCCFFSSFDCSLWIGVSYFIGAHERERTHTLFFARFYTSLLLFFCFSHSISPQYRCISWEYCNLSERAPALDFAI